MEDEWRINGEIMNNKASTLSSLLYDKAGAPEGIKAWNGESRLNK